MIMKEERLKLKKLLCETISLLCRSELPQQPVFHVEALIGITLEEDDVLLISFKEIIRSDRNALTGHSRSNYNGVALIDSEQSDYHVDPSELSNNKCKEVPAKLNHLVACDDSVDFEQFVENDCAADELKKPSIFLSPKCVSSKQKSRRPRCLTSPPNTVARKLFLASERKEHSMDDKCPLENPFSNSILSHCDNEDGSSMNLKRGKFDSVGNMDSADYNQGCSSSGGAQHIAYEARERFKQEHLGGWHKSIAPPESETLEQACSHRGSYGVKISIKQEIQDIAALKSETADSGFVVDGLESFKIKRTLSETFPSFGSPLYPEELYEDSDGVVSVDQQLLPASYDRATLGMLYRSAHLSAVEVSDSIYQCHICAATLRGRRTLQEHIRGTHLCVHLYRCQYCGVTFKWRSGLRRHRTKCHLAPYKGPRDTNEARMLACVPNDEVILD